MTQAAIFESVHPHTYHLEYERLPDSDLEACKRAIQAILALRAEFPGVVLGVGSEFWSELAPESVPCELRPFDALEGPEGLSAPSTQGDLFLWIHGSAIDQVFARARAAHATLGAAFELIDETPGFEQSESRDLIGFVDGSANPKGDDQQTAALIPTTDPCAGGSYIMTQKWVHDLAKFEGQDITAQEKIVGRTKVDSIELEGDAMPDDSHVSRTDAKVDGVAQKILRQSTPFGSVADHGLYFLAFSCELSRFDVQLLRMYGLTDDGLHDRLIEYSQAITGAYWYAPSESQLSDVFG
jgi:porphyrinogen peroxidase